MSAPMSGTHPRLSAVRRRTTMLVLASLLSIGYLLTRLWPGPERLLDLPFRRYGSVLTVLDGELYYQVSRPNTPGLMIRAMPVRGGDSRLVLRDLAAGQATGVEVTREGIYYRVPEGLLPATSSGPGGPPSGGGMSGGVFIPPPPGAGAPGAGASLMGKPPAPPPRPQTVLLRRRPRMHLWHAPLQGGTPRELLPEIRAVDLRVSGEYCYWMRSKLIGPGPLLRVPLDRPPIPELMVSPLRGGPAHRIALIAETLWVNSGTAFWRMRQRGRSTLVTTSPPDFSLRVMNDFTGEEAPLLLGDRFYWLGRASAPGNGIQRRTHQLVSCRPDGTDFQVLLDVDPQLNGQEVLSELRRRDSDLLFYRTTASTRSAAYALCRFRPGVSRPENLTSRMSNVSDTIWPDGDYAYFLRFETRENWFDWSANGLMARRISVLHRVAAE